MQGARRTIAVFTKNRLNPAYEAARLGAARTAARLGARTVDYVPARPDDVQEQIALIDRALAEGPDAVLLVPVHETAIDTAARRIVAAGVPLVTCINRLGADDLAACFVGSDDYALAVAVAERLFDRLGGRGDVVILEGTPGAVTSRDRVRGYVAAAAARPEIRVVASRPAHYLHDNARRVMRELLAEHSRVDGVIAANDSMALGAIEALAEARREALVVGANAIPDAIAALKAGRLLATVDFDAHRMACVGAEAALRILRGLPVPREILLPVQVIDRANCGPWDRPIDERAAPDWDAVVAGRSTGDDPRAGAH